MANHKNLFREKITRGEQTICTRVWSTQPMFIEALGNVGLYDYFEFVAEYAPFNPCDFGNMTMAGELHNLSSMIKVDFQNRAWVAQKAIASGFQSVLFTDCKTVEEIKESINFIKPDTPSSGGRFGYPNGRYIGYDKGNSQLSHAKRANDIVIAFMIEKSCLVDSIKEVCSVDGIDMIQFGPSDYSMSRGWNLKDHLEEAKEVEKYCIEIAIRNGIRPRCEIHSPENAEYYLNLGVKDFSISDQMAITEGAWKKLGQGLKEVIEKK